MQPTHCTINLSSSLAKHEAADKCQRNGIDGVDRGARHRPAISLTQNKCSDIFFSIRPCDRVICAIAIRSCRLLRARVDHARHVGQWFASDIELPYRAGSGCECGKSTETDRRMIAFQLPVYYDAKTDDIYRYVPRIDDGQEKRASNSSWFQSSISQTRQSFQQFWNDHKVRSDFPPLAECLSRFAGPPCKNRSENQNRRSPHAR